MSAVIDLVDNMSTVAKKAAAAAVQLAARVVSSLAHHRRQFDMSVAECGDT